MPTVHDAPGILLFTGQALPLVVPVSVSHSASTDLFLIAHHAAFDIISKVQSLGQRRPM